MEEAHVPTWTLVEELRIGSLDDGHQALTRVEPYGLAVGPGGQVFVAQPRAAEVRVYDAAGGLVRVIGRRGRGPGEFSRLVGIGFLGDTLYAVDRSPGRVSRFTAAGEHLGTTEVAYPPPTPYHSPTPPLRLFPDGTGVLSPYTLWEAYARNWVEAKEFVRIDRLGRRVRELLSFSEPDGLYMAPAAGGVLALDHPMPEYPLVAFAADGSRMAVVERGVEAADGARFGITELTLDGDTLHATRAVDRWQVYVDGERVARLEVPAGFEVHAIHDDAVWGVEVDEFDVPYVVRYRVRS